jgi:hypothetical protein
MREESERELAATTAQRDSITAQLGNVRQMLATLGGGGLMESLGAPEKPAPNAQPAPVEAAAPAPEQAEAPQAAEQAPVAEASDHAAEASDEQGDSDESYGSDESSYYERGPHGDKVGASHS